MELRLFRIGNEAMGQQIFNFKVFGARHTQKSLYRAASQWVFIEEDKIIYRHKNIKLKISLKLEKIYSL